MRSKTAQLCALVLAIFSSSLSPCFAFEYVSADLEQLKKIDPAVIQAEDNAVFIDRYLDELQLPPELHLMLRKMLPQHPHLSDADKFAQTTSYDERGERALAESDPASAISCFVKALQLDPTSNEARDHLITAYERFEQQQSSANASSEEITKKESALSYEHHGPYDEEATRLYNQGVELHQAGYLCQSNKPIQCSASNRAQDGGGMVKSVWYTVCSAAP
jgi:tetratricopeptide (TPR) repeat protein